VIMIIIERSSLDRLFEKIKTAGYNLIGPTIRDDAVVYDELNSTNDLPIGWTDEQDGGKYRLVKRNDNALFGYVVGPQSWKRFLNPPLQRLWQAKRLDNKIETIPEQVENTKYAFIGVRSCELNAILIQDKVFIGGEFVNSSYQKLRKDNLIIAVNCTISGGTCFCVSMNTGPKVKEAFDLALTEVITHNEHYFLVETGSESGKILMEDIPQRMASQNEINTGEELIKKTSDSMGRSLDTNNIKELLFNNFDHTQWDKVASRCLSCANCTMVCPTCFCTTVEDVTDLSGSIAERWQKWDSCFTLDFSYIHGGSIRSSVKSRYRQWMTHKLSTWFDQFGTSGCVGCGRCITWCPVAIDITEEVRVIRESDNLLTISKEEKSNGIA